MAKSIGTHDGKFHVDEVFACYMLKTLPQFKDHVIVRTRDPAILETCDVVLDVGGIYDHEKKRYDHTQRDFKETMNSLLGIKFHTKLSSAGLVYAHYGKEVIANLLKIDVNNPVVELLFLKLYKIFVESIDAINNGIQQFDGKPRFVTTTSINHRVSDLNPTWNDKSSLPDDQFSKAMKIVSEEFEDKVKYLFNSWIPARELVVKAIENRKKVHPSGKILAFEIGLPYKDHFFKLEKKFGLEREDICIVIYKDESHLAGLWNVQAIPVSQTNLFQDRIAIPWRGLRDAELERESGIPGAKFVHLRGFIGAADTREGALSMAVKTLEACKKYRLKF